MTLAAFSRGPNRNVPALEPFNEKPAPEQEFGTSLRLRYRYRRLRGAVAADGPPGRQRDGGNAVDASGHETTSSDVASARSPVTQLAIISLPLLVGLFVQSAGLLAVATPVLSRALGPRVWPRASRTLLTWYGVFAFLLVWVLPWPLTMMKETGTFPIPLNLGGTIDMIIALCSYDLPYVWRVGLPAVVATGIYALGSLLAVRLGRPSLWVVASMTVPVVHALVYTNVISATGAKMLC